MFCQAWQCTYLDSNGELLNQEVHSFHRSVFDMGRDGFWAEGGVKLFV